MHAYCIRKNAGSLVLTVSLILSASAYGQTAISDLAPSDDHRTAFLRDEETGLSTQSMSDTALSSGNPEPCAAPAICPPPSASVNKLDNDLPSPTSLKTKTHRDIYSRPSTANNSFKSDQTKDERGRTVMGH